MDEKNGSERNVVGADGPAGPKAPPPREPGSSYDAATREALLAEFASSGESMERFSRSRGISPMTLRKWLRAERGVSDGAAPGATRGTSGTTDAERPARRSAKVYSPEERRKAVEAFLSAGMPVKAFAAIWGVADKTLIKWTRRYRAGGPKALEPKSRGRPRREGPPISQLPAATRAAVTETKRRFPTFGLRKVRDYVARFFGLRTSAGAVRTALLAEGLHETPPPPKRKLPKREPLRFERARPMQLWQSDITSFTLARQSRTVYLTVFLDDHSRFVVGFALELHQRQELVIAAYLEGAARFGKPEEVLTDQGRQYFAWRGKSGFQRLLDKEGVRHVVSRAHHPETLGKCERLWETVFREFWERAKPTDLADARERLRKWIGFYNHFRPHQGIGGVVPADRFFQAEDPLRRTLEATVSKTDLEASLSEPARKPVYLFGQLGDRAVSLHGERGRLVITTPDGGRQELRVEDMGASAEGARENDDEAGRRSGGESRDGHDGGRDAKHGAFGRARVGGGACGDDGRDERGAFVGAEAHASGLEADEVRDPAKAGAVGSGVVDAGDGGGSAARARDGDGVVDELAREGDEGGDGGDARNDGVAGVAVVAAGDLGDARGVADAAARASGASAERGRDGGDARVDAPQQDREARERASSGGGVDRLAEGDAHAPGRGDATVDDEVDGRRAGEGVVGDDGAARGGEKSKAAEFPAGSDFRRRSATGSDGISAANGSIGEASSSSRGAAT
jgi:transposase InsO family protein